jgi:MYXO-CTERM domain-containing protein
VDTSRDRLPRASVLVCATVLSVGPSVAAYAGEPEASTEASGTDDGTTEGGATEAGQEIDLEQIEIPDNAPTCGPCCHGSNDPECHSLPPPIIPAATKKGCAVHPDGSEPSGALAMLALLLAVARRREG